jgi:SPP1 family predicted phage head-tail adaptor
MGISSGLLNQTLILQTFTSTDDGMGGTVDTWADAGSFRGRISSLSTQERMAQDKEQAFYTHKIFCDPMNVSHKDRIKWGDYYFEIVGISNPSELYHHLEIQARELVD